MAGFVIDGMVGFRFHNAARATFPAQLATDQITGAIHGIAGEKIGSEGFHVEKCGQRTIPG